MTRLVMILLWAVLAATTARAADGPWDGQWELTWGNGGALVRLAQDGTTVSGSFGGGRITGTADGGSFAGQLIYNGGSEAIRATLDETGDSFAGTTESGDWLNGVRIMPGSPQARLTIDLSNPRAALNSFLTAATLARADKLYALSSALEAIDFGNDPGWDSRDERFTGARLLFDLIDRATFGLSSIPDDTTAQSLSLKLPIADSVATIALDMARDAGGKWQIVMPPPDTLRAELGDGQSQAADNYRLMQNPRDTMRAFLDGMHRWTTGGERQAIDALDLSHIPDVLRQTEGSVVAQYLVRVIDQMGQPTLINIPNSGATRQPFVYLELPAGRVVIEPVGTGKDTRWKFSAGSLRQIRDIYRATEQLPDHQALDPSFIPASGLFEVRNQVRRYAPRLLHVMPGPAHIEIWQFLGALLTLATILVTTMILRRLLLLLLARPVFTRHVQHPNRLALGLALGLCFLAGSRVIYLLGLPAAARQYTMPVVGSLLIVLLAYTLWQVVAFVLSILQEMAEKTDTAFDNILLTFAAGLSKLAIVLGAVMALSYIWSLPTTGLIAGLGVSGLAVAFASKETIANLFGAGILLGDRPFRKGDRIVAGDVNGWVEAVGLRSTRIRTLYDSMMVVPNGKLADMVVDNLGARRRRSLLATVIVTAGATPERMEAFVDAIRQRVKDDPIFEGEWAEVRILRFWHEGIDVEISTMMETRSGRQSRAATHQLYLDIMRIADRLGLSLAHATEASRPPVIDMPPGLPPA